MKYRGNKKCQSGGVYQTPEQINQANAFAQDFARRRHYGRGINPDQTTIGRQVGDPVVPFIDSRTGLPAQSIKTKKAMTVPSGINLQDIQSQDGQYWYTDPQTGDVVDVDQSVINLPRFRQKRRGGKLQDGGYQGLRRGLSEPVAGFEPALPPLLNPQVPANAEPTDLRPPVEPRNPWDPSVLLRGASTAASFVGGILERGRQNKYMQEQMSQLAQRQPMPNEYFQPNPYNLYAKYGGKLSKYQKGGRTPIYTDNPNDPRLKAYKDSLNLYNLDKNWRDAYSKSARSTYNARHEPSIKTQEEYSDAVSPDLKKSIEAGKKYFGYDRISNVPNEPRVPVTYITHGGDDGDNRKLTNNPDPHENLYEVKTKGYKKPVQPVVYQKQPAHILDKASKAQTISSNTNVPSRLPAANPVNLEQAKTDYSYTYRTDNGQQKSMYFKDWNTWNDFVQKQPFIDAPTNAAKSYGRATGHYLKQQMGGVPNPSLPLDADDESVYQALENAKKLKIRNNGKFKALLPFEEWNDDVMNYADKIKFVTRRGNQYIKLRGKLKRGQPKQVLSDLQLPTEIEI